jgi:microcystin-dependent protein
MSNYTLINRYNALINKVQKNNNMDDSAIGDLKWSIRYDDFRGWLRCDGREVSQSNYPRLYNLLGSAFGSASSGNFKLPDARSRVMGMASHTLSGSSISGEALTSGLSQRNLGNVTGTETHTLTVGEMPSHLHTGTTNVDGAHIHDISDPGHSHSYINNTNDQNTDNAFSTETAADNADLTATSGLNTTGISVLTGNSSHSHNFTTGNTGGSQPHNNMQPTLFIGHVFIYAGDFFDPATNNDD